jgi:hypothetical protein
VEKKPVTVPMPFNFVVREEMKRAKANSSANVTARQVSLSLKFIISYLAFKLKLVARPKWLVANGL